MMSHWTSLVFGAQQMNHESGVGADVPTPSWLERKVMSGGFAPTVGGLATFMAIVIALYDHTTIALLVLIPGASLAVLSVGLRFFSRQIKSRAEMQVEKLSDGFQRQAADIENRYELVIAQLHLLVHAARNGTADCLAHIDQILGPDGVIKDLDLYLASGAEKRDRILEGLARQVLSVFQALSPDVDLWLELRQIRSDGCYHDLILVGAHASEREQIKIPIPQDKGLPNHIRTRQRVGKGIILFDELAGRPPEQWLETELDRLGDEQSSIAGPVHVLRSSDSRSGPIREMAMVLRVCSPSKNVFRAPVHIQPMKCCVDVFSMFLGSIADAVVDIR